MPVEATRMTIFRRRRSHDDSILPRGSCRFGTVSIPAFSRIVTPPTRGTPSGDVLDRSRTGVTGFPARISGSTLRGCGSRGWESSHVSSRSIGGLATPPGFGSLGERACGAGPRVDCRQDSGRIRVGRIRANHRLASRIRHWSPWNSPLCLDMSGIRFAYHRTSAPNHATRGPDSSDAR